MRFDSAKKFIFPKWKEGGVNPRHLDYFKFSDRQKQRDFERELIKDYITENTDIKFGKPQYLSFFDADGQMTFDISYRVLLKGGDPGQTRRISFGDSRTVHFFDIFVVFEVDVMESSVEGRKGRESLFNFRNIGKFNESWSDSIIRFNLVKSLNKELNPSNINVDGVEVYYLSNGISESVVMDMDHMKRLLK
jgi:hypothetical protein